MLFHFLFLKYKHVMITWLNIKFRAQNIKTTLKFPSRQMTFVYILTPGVCSRNIGGHITYWVYYVIV